ncbi:hypothetical protein P389DRAFT_193098 [Cystobasidium minutum MCA 4210]|uniref:uncharacterized protein n=1 Tax=Cystobasidium minutum MCA 4210 TaxID=1397322 RepID=UPI0034CEF12D|eukprot:jgi/Rhomi1/193098/gm1.1312_g
MSKPSILLTGLPWDHPAVKALGQDPEVIKQMLENTVQEVRAAGYEDFTPVWASPESGLDELVTRLKEKHWHGLIIGMGVRASPQLTPYLEEIIETTHNVSPKTKILFNTSPKDNLDAIKRCKFP